VEQAIFIETKMTIVSNKPHIKIVCVFMKMNFIIMDQGSKIELKVKTPGNIHN